MFLFKSVVNYDDVFFFTFLNTSVQFMWNTWMKGNINALLLILDKQV